VDIVATPTGTDFQTAASQSVRIRLVPPGVILPPASTPTAAFTLSPSPAAANVPLQFDASTSQPGTGASQIVSYSWNFGDGASGTGKTVTHTYATQGTYTVTLTVTNDRTLSASTTQQVAVASGAMPTAVFTFSPASPAVNQTVFFNASTSTAGAGHTIAAYRWTFGDGGTASGVTVSHAYPAAGAYIVQLTVVDDAGQSVTSTGTTITPGSAGTLTANFTFSPSAPVVGDLVVFDYRTSTTSPGQRIVSLDWNFGDSTPVVHCPGHAACTSDGITTHTFGASGTFAVNLVVTDSGGRTNAITKSVTVGSGNPVAVLTLTKAGGTTVGADGSTSSANGGATITNYTFFWGDGTPATSGTAPAASHTYGAVGTYTVTLRVTDSLGRTGTSPPQSVTVP
jgi:PKD repeat protein